MNKAKTPSAKKTMIGGGSWNYRGYQIERIDGRWISRLSFVGTKTLKDAKFLIDQKVPRELDTLIGPKQVIEWN